MTTLTQTLLSARASMGPARDRESTLREHLPRRCMVISTTLILAALAIPLLMLMGWLPISLATSFAGWALAVTGGTLVLTLCGEL